MTNAGKTPLTDAKKDATAAYTAAFEQACES